MSRPVLEMTPAGMYLSEPGSREYVTHFCIGFAAVWAELKALQPADFVRRITENVIRPSYLYVACPAEWQPKMLWSLVAGVG